MTKERSLESGESDFSGKGSKLRYNNVQHDNPVLKIPKILSAMGTKGLKVQVLLLQDSNFWIICIYNWIIKTNRLICEQYMNILAGLR